MEYDDMFLSATFVNYVTTAEDVTLFSPRSSTIILVLPHQKSWQNRQINF